MSSRELSCSTGSQSYNSTWDLSAPSNPSLQVPPNKNGSDYLEPDKNSSTAILEPNPRRNTVDLDSVWTINKLDFTKLTLYGREKQVTQLHQALDELLLRPESTGNKGSQIPSHQRHVVWIHGESGTGKSRLACSIVGMVRTQKGLLGKGKFDERQGVPYAALTQACGEICARILLAPDDNKAVVSALQESIGAEKDVLIPFVPSLAEFLQQSSSHDDVSDSDSIDAQRILLTATADGKKRFQFALVRFLQVLLQHFLGPLVLIMDDMQWADSPTLELLQVLLTEHTLERFMIIATYRSDEVDETHALSKTIQDLRDCHEAENSNSLGFTEIVVDNLGLTSVKDILRDLLVLDCGEKQLEEFASICLQRTHGNVFFLLQFLSLLHEKKFINFQYGTLSWKFDVEIIRSNVAPTLNVADVLQTKMRDMPESCMKVLKLAAFLGSTFQKEILAKLCTTQSAGEDSGDGGLQDIDSVLNLLEKEGYIARFGIADSFKWTHDKIQEAAYSLVHESDRVMYSRQLGETLLCQLNEKELESAIFVVVNLLNTGHDCKEDIVVAPKEGGPGESSRETLARLNLQGAQRALLFSAFETAADYAEHGIVFLGKDGWDTQPRLSLKLHSIAARVKMLIGHTERSEELCNTIISQQTIHLEEKLDAYATLVDTILARGKNSSAVDLLLEVLEKFDCRFPKNPVLVIVSLLKDLLRAKRIAKSIDVRKMNAMNDPTRSQLMRLLDKLSACMYIAKDFRLPLAIFRSFGWTVKYGFNDYSPVALATAGMMISGILGDYKGGSSYGEKAIQLVARTNARVSAARTMFCVYPAVFPWTKPVRTLLSPVLEAYKSGLRFGDTETAVNAVGYWMVLRFICGIDLDTIEADLARYTQQMRVLGKEKYAFYYGIKRQGIRNLMGRDNLDCPTRLQGSIFTVEAEAVLRDDVFHEVSIDSWEGLLLFYFGHYIAHADNTIKNGHDYLEKVHFCSSEIWWDTLLRAISCFEAARQTRKRKYLSMARKLRSKVNKWISKGNPNLSHYQAILDAEWNASRGKHTEAETAYLNAILFAARGGHQPEAAIASELYGKHQLLLGQTSQAAYRLSESIRYYRNWGACAVARDREEKYAGLLRIPVSPLDEQSAVSSLTGGPSQTFLSREKGSQ